MSGPPPEVPSPPNSAFPPHSSLPPYLTPWSDNPNAPRVSHDTYFMEKANFAGSLIGSILYGIIVVLFVQCMAALFNPVHRGKEGIKWGFVSYTVTIFLTVTVVTTTNLNTQSISFIDHRELPNFFPGILSGPMGYLWVLHQGPFGVVTNLAFLLNYLLADGLLLYRCYVIYLRNPWVIIFPCLMYLGALAMGIMMIISQTVDLGYTSMTPIPLHFGLPYLGVSVSLNVILTLMIVVQLALHRRNIRVAMGESGEISGPYKTVITILIESSALYAVSSLLVLGPTSAVTVSIGNGRSSPGIVYTFFPILAETQVIAPLLIAQRIANRSALTSNTIAIGHISSLNFFRSQAESTGGVGALPDGHPIGMTDERGKEPCELGIETTDRFPSG